MNLYALLSAVAAGQTSVVDALDEISRSELRAIDGATVDLGRRARCRFGEVIYGEGKPASLIAEIAQTQLSHNQPVLVTRIHPEAAALLQRSFPDACHDPVARTVRIPVVSPAITHSPPSPARDLGRPKIYVVTAGSTDIPVAAEALETLRWMNVDAEAINDVGVAGPQRILTVVPKLRTAAAIVVAAGMEGALPSVVGGHVPCPVIAVPTSVCYGTNFGGITAMLGMLTSCTSNVTVVGIDAGFKAGYVAGLIATRIEDTIRQIQKRDDQDH